MAGADGWRRLHGFRNPACDGVTPIPGWVGQLGCYRRPAYVWARSRRVCNRVHKAIHGNIGDGPATVLVANITSFKGAWQTLRLEQVDLLILQEVRMGAAELQKLAAEANCQVVYGEALEGEILVAVLARTGTLTKVATCPSGQAHHCRW